jgi:arylsulfatase A-like enzyme
MSALKADLCGTKRNVRLGSIADICPSSLDWLPTFVEIAGGPKGNALNEQIMAGRYPGIVKTKLDGVNQIDYLTGKSQKSARDTSLRQEFSYFFQAFPFVHGNSVRREHDIEGPPDCL